MPIAATIAPHQHAAPGASLNPGGRTINRPSSVRYSRFRTYLREPADPGVKVANSAGNQVFGSRTWRMPTAALAALKSQRIVSARSRRCRSPRK
jgi:hypothetical protein